MNQKELELRATSIALSNCVDRLGDAACDLAKALADAIVEIGRDPNPLEEAALNSFVKLQGDVSAVLRELTGS